MGKFVKYQVDLRPEKQYQDEGRRVNLYFPETPHVTDRNDTYLAQKVQLAVDARAMLIANVDVSDGLCNGMDS